MIRRRGLLVLLAVIASSLIVAQSSPATAASADLRLISQSFNVSADGTLTATLGLPSTMSNADLATADVVITVLQRVDKREDLLPIIQRKLVRPDDAVTISPGCCAGNQADQFTITVPLETAEVRPDVLSIPRAGLYPLTIAVQRDGRVLTSVLSFLNRLPAADESVDTESISVGMAIGTHSSAHLDSNATISLDPSTNAEMSRLADVLDALNAHHFTATVRLAPAVLNGLQQLNPSVFSRLIADLQSHQVVAEPQWPLDASAAAIAKQDVLYTSWRRAGQAQFAGLGLGRSVVSTATILTDQPISAEGASLRFRDGAQLTVVSPEIYDELAGSIKTFSDYKGELIEAKLPDDVTLDVAVVDHAISELLVHPLPTIEQTRIYAVADLLALRQRIAIQGASVQRHAVVLGARNLDVPDPALIGPIVELIAATPGLAASRLDDVALHTDRLLLNGDEQPVTLPAGNAEQLKARIFLKASLDNEIAAVASMLPADSERPKGWRDLAELLPTTALDDLAAQGMATSIRADLDEIRGAVQAPTTYTVNLPGRRGTVRLRFLNNSDVPLKIKVRLSSPPGKLVFDNISDPIELEPGVPREVPIAVEARSNGTSGVSLDVFTPNDDQLVDTIPLTFRVRALGLGNVITGILFGLVLLWWLEHLRSVREKAATRFGSYPACLVSTNHVRIVTDSACDLPQTVADELAVEIVPLTIRIDGKEYIDRQDLSVAEFWAKCAASPTLPETAAPSPGQFEQTYRRLSADGATSIVTISLSGALSATMQSAELAARSVSDVIPVTVVDSRSVTLGLGAIVSSCAALAATGASHDEVTAHATELAGRTRVWGALDTLDNLKKGGRIGGAKALLASALAIKPIIEVRDGKVEQGGKQRTRSKALAFLVDKVAATPGLDRVYVLHADCRDVDQFVEMLRPHVDGPIIVGDIGPVVGSHAGHGTIGVAFFDPR